MGKPPHPRALTDTQARAVGRNIRTSARKLNLVAQSIRGQKAEAALVTLTFSPKRIAINVKKILQSAIANAENNHDLDVDDLVVSEASVGRNLVMKRFRARARGRAGQIEKPYSQLTIVVEERREKARASKAKAKAKAKVSAAKKPAKDKQAASKNPATKESVTEKPAAKPAKSTAKATAKAPAKEAAKGTAPARRSAADKMNKEKT
ncbi:MAG: 50S ribosomal protein L22 [Proteobacteria bacterium]|nr:50S ribosomal protein L22 [Pseudomonadota bacterium]